MFGPAPDYLGSSWQARTLFLKDDDGGATRPDVAVLVHEADAKERVSRSGTVALYLPGFQDSFFHTEQAAGWAEYDIPLIGLEFRRSGRALRSEASRDDIRDLRVRNEEISRAIDYTKQNLGAAHVILIGHSTGGLQAALWASENPGVVSSVILNSPWLDHNGPEYEKTTLTEANDHLGKVSPRLVISRLNPAYARNLHNAWHFNTAHKRVDNLKVRAGFWRTVRRAQADVAAARVRIYEPLLVAHSDRSGNYKEPSPEDLLTSDCVLNVEDMKRLAPLLSPKAQLLEISGGRHDLALSERPARDFYTRDTIEWAIRRRR
ncbi:alpha/beta hydrolase [Ancrocorticia populi]|uniref:alpha/beta hydrolase n=2 Tax=Ancrocorticia populi TaxID=2175228 RepID=UPI002353D14A|nr:alpha/beta fold hydrolase [Ancrocorticia populi]